MEQFVGEDGEPVKLGLTGLRIAVTCTESFISGDTASIDDQAAVEFPEVLCTICITVYCI